MKKQKIDIRQSRYAKSGLHDLCMFISQRAPITSMAEIGSFAGNSTEIFLQHFEYLLCVDPWESGFDDNDAISNPASFNMEEVYHQFQERIIQHCRDRITVYRCNSQEAAQKVNKESLDFAYIDGNHQPDFVQEDIELWLPKVKIGGFIGGHDYGSRKYPHIKAIVDNKFSNIITFKDSSWVAQKR